MPQNIKLADFLVQSWPPPENLINHVLIHNFTCMTNKDRILVSIPMFGCVTYLNSPLAMPSNLNLCLKTFVISTIQCNLGSNTYLGFPNTFTRGKPGWSVTPWHYDRIQNRHHKGYIIYHIPPHLYFNYIKPNNDKT